MARDGTDHSSAFVRIIRETRERMQTVRNQYLFEKVQHGGVSRETARDLSAMALVYHDVLSEFEDKRHVRDLWAEDELQALVDVADKTVAVSEPAPGDSASANTRQMPAVLQLDHRTIYQATKQLDKIANALGFAASAKDPTPKDEADESDLIHLLRARGQKQALKNLPDSWGVEVDEPATGD